MGDVPSDVEDPERVTPQGGLTDGKIQPKSTGAGRWIYPPLDEAMMAVVLEEVDTYVIHRQNNVAQYIATGPIIELCLIAERQTGAQVSMRWW